MTNEIQTPEVQNPVALSGDQQVARRREDHLLMDLFGVNPLFPLFEKFPNVAPRFQSARWGVESSERLADGTQLVKFNLAGWKRDEVKVSLNTALNRLTVSAERGTDSEESTERRQFSSTFTVTPGTTNEQLKVTHEDGILSLFIRPPAEDSEHTFDIPVD